MLDWDEAAARMVAQYRASMAEHVAEPAWKNLVARLNRSSPEFAEMWARHDIRGPENAIKRIQHPLVGGRKLDRAPTLIVASVVRAPDPIADEEDMCAAACACFIVLAAAHARGLAGYWRTPAVLRTAAGLDAVGVPAGERVLGLLHLGPPAREAAPPERVPPAGFVRYLD